MQRVYHWLGRIFATPDMDGAAALLLLALFPFAAVGVVAFVTAPVPSLLIWAAAVVVIGFVSRVWKP